MTNKPNRIPVRVFNFNRYEHIFNVGEYVKITHTDENGSNGESMWFEIIEAKGYLKEETFKTGLTRNKSSNTKFKGKTYNNSMCGGPEPGEIIEFDISHIIDNWRS